MRGKNKATRLNRTMLYGTLFLGLVVIGVSMGALYWSFDVQKQNQETEALGDSLLIEVNDSIFI